MPGYVVAGKTGTASIAEHGVYLQDATIASFVGFVPAQNPAFVMYIKIDRPKDTPWGSETAAPLFSSISKELLLYLHVPPTEPVPTPTPAPHPTPAATDKKASGQDGTAPSVAAAGHDAVASNSVRPASAALRQSVGDARRATPSCAATTQAGQRAQGREHPSAVPTAKGR